MTYVNAKDIAKRLFHRRPFWFHGKPHVTLRGEEQDFGVLRFDFHDGDILEYTIYITDRKAILSAAQSAVDNFKSFCEDFLGRLA